MNEYILRDLYRLREQAAELSSQLAQTHSHLPEGAEGIDQSGSVRVLLAGSWQPESIQIGSSWRRSLRAEDVSAAVMEAFQAAVASRMERWSHNLQGNGQGSGTETPRETRLQEVGDPVSLLPPRLQQRLVEAPSRSLDSLSEELLDELEHVGELSAQPQQPTAGTGSSRCGSVAIVVSDAGLLSCSVDPRWAATRSGTELGIAFGEALAAAKDDHARMIDVPDPGDRLDSIFAEALALLRNPDRLAHS